LFLWLEIAAIVLEGNKIKQINQSYCLDYVNKVYSQARLTSFYSTVVEPCALNMEDLKRDGITPPMAGRPKMLRYLRATDPQSKCACSSCGKKGHNKAGCDRWHRQEAAKALRKEQQAAWKADEEPDNDEEMTEERWYYRRTTSQLPSISLKTDAPLTFEEAFGNIGPTHAEIGADIQREKEQSPQEAAPVAKRPRGHQPKPKQASLKTLTLNVKTTLASGRAGRGGNGGRGGGRGGGRSGRGAVRSVITRAAKSTTTSNMPIASVPVACSLCNVVGHNDRECKENLLQHLEKKRQEKEASQRIPLLEEENEDEVVVVDVTQDGGEDGVLLSSSTPNVDEDFISMMAAMGEE
jgi:hypothetical protein